MIKISHYEVYADRGNGWRLEERFSSDERHEAINLAKEIEQDKVKVKIIKETFDGSDNTYQETIEYVSNLRNNKKKKSRSVYNRSYDALDKLVVDSDDATNLEISKSGVTMAIMKLLFIIILCLVIANVLVSLIVPVIEAAFPEFLTRSILFVLFFVLFLAIAIPLLLKKVPWYVFSEKVTKVTPGVQQKFLKKADVIYNLYNINDSYEDDITPVFPAAPLEYKAYIVTFLTSIMNEADSKTAFRNSFSKLGLKFVIYGGCLELSRYGGLKITEANSLLNECFEIIEGKNVDLVGFYEARRAYKDNKFAVFLTGVGAYLMAQAIDGQPLDTHILKETFSKWEMLNPDISERGDVMDGKDISYNSMVNIKSNLKFLDEIIPQKEEMAQNVSATIREIISNLVGKFEGANIVEANGITSISFSKLNYAIRFAEEYLKDIDLYQDDMNDEEVLLENMVCIVDYDSKNEPNLNHYLEDILHHTNNDEILLTGEIAKNLADTRYKTEFLGEKKLDKTEKTVELYKLL